jgi:hypothetical protein
MYAANTYVIRHAAPADAAALAHLAQLDSNRPLEGRVLIGEIDGKVAAALSLHDGRVIADPFQRTARLTPLMRMRASAIVAAERTPSLRDRIRAATRVARVSGATA